MMCLCCGRGEGVFGMAIDGRVAMRERCLGSALGVARYNIYNIEREMEEQVESSGEEEHFSQEEIVWAKITGYPWWPALITGAATGSGTFRVDFFADNTQ